MNERYTLIFASGYSISVLALLLVFHFYPSPNDSNLSGRLLDGEGFIISYYFGSSLGSRNKDNASLDKKEEEK